MPDITGTLAVAAVLIIAAVIFAFKSIQVVPQQTAWIVERLGKFHAVLNPGLNFIIPFIDKVAYKHSLKENHPRQSPSVSRRRTVLSGDGS